MASFMKKLKTKNFGTKMERSLQAADGSFRPGKLRIKKVKNKKRLCQNLDPSRLFSWKWKKGLINL